MGKFLTVSIAKWGVFGVIMGIDWVLPDPRLCQDFLLIETTGICFRSDNAHALTELVECVIDAYCDLLATVFSSIRMKLSFE